MMTISVKTFDELTVYELYEILRLRSEIFVMEQECIYVDPDGKDVKALHVLGKKNGKIVAYTRVFKAGDYAAHASIGRVLVKAEERRNNYGKKIMASSIRAVEERFNDAVIHVSAQLYLERFYSELGFEQVGSGYLEDGIPHIGMIKK